MVGTNLVFNNRCRKSPKFSSMGILGKISIGTSGKNSCIGISRPEKHVFTKWIITFLLFYKPVIVYSAAGIPNAINESF